MASYQQIIDVAVQMFTRNQDPNSLDSDVALTAQALAPTVLQDVAIRYSGDERSRQILKRNFTVTTVNGTATLDGSVLTSTMDDSFLYDPASTSDIYSFQRNYASLNGQLDERLGYYAISLGAQIVVQLPNTQFVPGAGPSQAFSLNVAAVPEIPLAAAVDADVPWAQEFQSDFTNALAEALRGAPQPA